MSLKENLTNLALNYWIRQILEPANRELSEEKLVNYGIALNGPLPSDEEIEIITVSDTVIPSIADI
uniref:Uncharacterized protein n=1 Tax=Amphimedon queenslandica TaxID=400682 RepID=A0A1X7UDV2_AMPQE